MQIVDRFKLCNSNTELAQILLDIQDSINDLSYEDFDLLVRSVKLWADSATALMLITGLPIRATLALATSLGPQIFGFMKIKNIVFTDEDNVVTPELSAAFDTTERLDNFINGVWTGPRKHVVRDWAVLAILLDENSFKQSLPYIELVANYSRPPIDLITQEQIENLRPSLLPLSSAYFAPSKSARR